MKSLTLTILLAVIPSLSNAEGIDLDCEALAGQMVDQLRTENLLRNTSGAEARARKIALGLCSDSQTLAQQQHETETKKALSDWIWQSVPETAGHRRLKKR